MTPVSLILLSEQFLYILLYINFVSHVNGSNDLNEILYLNGFLLFDFKYIYRKNENCFRIYVIKLLNTFRFFV